jgi:hypothetical protein
MVDRRTRVLLLSLSAVIMASAAAVFLQRGMERLAAAREKAHSLQRGIGALARQDPWEEDLAARIAGLDDELVRARARFYSDGEVTPWSFGAAVRNELISLGLRVRRYEIEGGGGQVLFRVSLSGSARQLMTFLRSVSESEKYRRIESFSLTAPEGAESVEADFRIGYAAADTIPR